MTNRKKHVIYSISHPLCVDLSERYTSNLHKGWKLHNTITLGTCIVFDNINLLNGGITLAGLNSEKNIGKFRHELTIMIEDTNVGRGNQHQHRSDWNWVRYGQMGLRSSKISARRRGGRRHTPIGQLKC
jgi:hypothetical protein